MAQFPRLINSQFQFSKAIQCKFHKKINTDDRQPIDVLARPLFGKLYADKGLR